MLSQRLTSKLIRLARASIDLPRSSKKHFSFLINRNKIIAYGFNDGFRSHPIAARYGHRFNGIHAELAVILNFPYSIRELSQYTLVNLRLKVDLSLGLARPCKFCVEMLSDFGIGQVYYSNNLNHLSKLEI